MVSGKRPSSGAGSHGGNRRRRPSSIIDLKATEVATERAASSSPAEPSAAPPAPDTAFIPPLPEQPVPPFIPPEAERPRPAFRPPLPEDSDPPVGERPEPARGSVTWLPPEFPWPQVGAGATGAAVVLLAAVLVWLAGSVGREDSSVALTQRLAAIENQLRDLAARPQPARIDPRALEDVSARLVRVETTLAAPRQPVTDPAVPIILGRLAATENSIKSISDSVAGLGRRTDATAAAQTESQNAARASTADHGELTAVSERIAALERANRTLADELAKRPATTGNDNAVRLAVTAGALRSAVERGDSFSAELAAVRPLVSDANALAALEPFAASGVPSNVALGRELAGLVQPMLRAAGSNPTPRDGGFIDRLQANAERLVRVRPIDEAPGDDPAPVLARIETKAAQADVPGALNELAKLPPVVRAPAQAWIAKAEARRHAVEASRRLAAQAIAALKAAP